MIRPWLKRLRKFVVDIFQRNRKATKPKQTWDASTRDHGFTISQLNRDAARRQAKIGKGYARHRTTWKRLAELKKGTVTLPPHKPWTGDYTDWSADPFNDLNWRFQFHTLRWINPLLWDALDGNDDSKAEWKRIVRSWAEANIPPERAQDKYAWMDMTDGNRAIQTSLGAPLADENDQWYVDMLVTHRDWLLDDSNIVPGNHGLHQNLGLFVVSVVLDDSIGTDRSIERLAAQILEAFDEEGLNEEGSVAYHQINVVWWLQAQKRLKLEGYDFSPEAVDRLEKAGEAMAYLVLPDGSMPQVGDGGRGRGRRGMHPLLDKVLKKDVGDAELPLFKHYDNGFTVMRSGWGQDRPFKEESHTIVRHGRDLRRHSHNDRGSVHIYTLGRRWITDGGFHSYQQRNRHRNYTKSRAAHSLVNLPEQRHDKTGDVPAELVQSSDDLQVIETLDENFESAKWRRRVVYLPTLDMWVIWDRIRSSEPQTIRQQWLIDIGVQVHLKDGSSVVLDDQTHQLHMRWFGDEPELDTARGNHKSKSKRGLIGIGWKKMRDGTSLHANFHTDSAESIVVISPTFTRDTHVNMVNQTTMQSFSMKIEQQDETYELTADASATTFRQSK